MLHQHVVKERIARRIIFGDISVQRLVKQLVPVLACLVGVVIFIALVWISFGVNIVVTILFVYRVIVRVKQGVVQTSWVWIFLVIFVLVACITGLVRIIL